MSQHNRILGKIGEDIALATAIKKGYQLVDRNVRTAAGEIDLILEQTGTLIFTEVKTRSGDRFGYPEEAITPAKLRRMILSAEYYLRQNKQAVPWRIDVVAIIMGQDGRHAADLQWMENVTA